MLKIERDMKTFIVTFLLGAWASLMAQSGRAAFQEGEQYRKNKQYDLALQKYDEAIRLEPTKAIYYARKGEVLNNLKRPNEAIQAYQKALELNPGLTAIYVRIAQIHIRAKNYPAAIDALNQAYAKEQDVSKKMTYKLNAIRLLNLQGRSQEALSELNALKAQVPQVADDPRLLYAEGETQLALNNPQAAIASFQRAYDKTRDLPIAQSARYTYGLALAHYRAGNTAEYERYAKQIENHPMGRRLKAAVARTGAAYNLAIAYAYFKTGALDEAMEYVNEAAKTKDRLNQVYQMQGAILFRKGRVAEAAQSFLQAAQNEPDEKKRSALYARTVRLQYNAGDYGGAVSTADRILEKNPNDANTLLLKAQALYLLGRYGEVISTVERTIPLLGTDITKLSQAYFLMGLAARKAGQVDKARDAFGKITSPRFKAAAKVELDKLSAR
ncbi:MAG: tetratricopeptide repeat protein [Bacteroidia bacterium]|nr:tetratricopeptide repeat protein [Bacteroidia bacterium]MCX7764494.1 tetratricopeptide repeat protein [Bacteroidia bacterium]MDW8056976.1 tetratricopeptide repeat protein [Bacteroidia bacterium]